MKKLLLVSALLLSTSAFADILIDNPRSRVSAPTVKVGGAFMDITNNGDTDDVLLSASTPRSGKTELHNTVIDENGVMKMREMENGIPIPAGETVVLKPGSLHVMFMDLHEPFKLNDTYQLTLKFKNAGEKMVTVTVKDMPHANNQHQHSMQKDMKHKHKDEMHKH